jgi:alkylation response protein AidB-like acyl-CoA dehydrogenase
MAEAENPGDRMNSLEGLEKLPRRCFKAAKKVVELAARFNDEVVRPTYKREELSVFHDDDYLPHEFIRECARRGFFSMWIPRMFGGGGADFISLYPFLEEISSVCTALANVIGVHYLGVGTLCASWNAPVMNRVMREVRRSELEGRPALISLAATEPAAGTDIEDPELLARARVGTIAARVDGGYRINGTKVFISNGHVSTWHMVIAYGDREKPAETSILAAVRTGTKGFSFGRHEKKMGQRACVASELVFDDCFVPDSLVASAPEHFSGFSRSPAVVAQYILDFILSSSRAGVAAFAAGAARGAYERALEYAKGAHFRGGPLIEQQCVQTMLAEMFKNAASARALYLESAYANAMKGMYKMMYSLPLYYASPLLPHWYVSAFVSPFMNTAAATRMLRKYYFEDYTDHEARVTSGLGSMAKFAASDLALKNAGMAIELMGMDGTRHEYGAEKFLRDAKLLQIYEGTNQLNRLNLFKNLIAPVSDGPKMFQ